MGGLREKIGRLYRVLCVEDGLYKVQSGEDGLYRVLPERDR